MERQRDLGAGPTCFRRLIGPAFLLFLIARRVEPRSPDYDETGGVDEPIRLRVVRAAQRNNCRLFINLVSQAGGGRDRVLTGAGAELHYDLIDKNGQVLENTPRGDGRPMSGA